MRLSNLNYKQGAIRLVVVLTLVFAFYGWYVGNQHTYNSWTWYLNSIKDEDMTSLAMKEAKKEKCSKASILEITWDKEKKPYEQLANQDTLLIILNKDESKPNVVGEDATKDCPYISQLSEFMEKIPSAKDKGLLVANITEAMFRSAESLQKRRVYMAYYKEAFSGSVEYVWGLWKVLAIVGLLGWLGFWTFKGFKTKE